MFSIALKYDIAELTGPHEDCDYTPAKYPEILGLLSHLCDALEEAGAVCFEVIAFADEAWPVDVGYDLSVVLRQVPEVLKAVRSRETTEFDLSFYEQGIERDLLFTRGQTNRIAVEFSTRLEWNPPRSVENIDTEELERQLVTLVKDFAQAARIVCPTATGSEVFREWLAGMSIPDEPAQQGMDARSQLASILAKNGRACNLDLHSADLAKADLSSLNADGLDLREADLCGAKLRDARFGHSLLEGAKCEESDWTGATLRMCVLDGAQAMGACFDNARVEDSSVKGANLTRASLRGAKLTETSFERSVLREAVLDDAEGEGVQLRGADLSGATLIGARLDDADFRGADLSRADLSRGRFQGADFRGAILDGVQWTDSDLIGALFDIDADPFQKPSPYEKEAESIARWVEEFLKSTFKGTASGSQQSPFSHPRKQADSAELREFLKALEKALETQGHQGEKMLSSFQNLLEVLEASSEQEPPEAWKPAITQLLSRLPKEGQDLNITELLNVLLETISQPPGPQAAPQTQEESRSQSEAHSDTEQTGAKAEEP